MIEDKAHTHASKNDKVGIVGESHIWDGTIRPKRKNARTRF